MYTHNKYLVLIEQMRYHGPFLDEGKGKGEGTKALILLNRMDYMNWIYTSHVIYYF